MATPSEKLAQSLEKLKKLQNEKGIAVVKSHELSRTHTERLVRIGFLKEVMKGWYISSHPEDMAGESTSWYRSFWIFAAKYLNFRFGNEWCLSPEQSLSLHSGNFTVPSQLLVRSPRAGNNIIKLLQGTSLFDLKLDIPNSTSLIRINGLQVYSLSDGLIAAGNDFFMRNAIDARTCLSMVSDASELLGKLLDGGKSSIAGRLAGAFRNIGKDQIAIDIVKSMKSAGYDVREEDPFNEKLLIPLNSREKSPYANRIKLLWHQFRQTVINEFPQGKGLPSNIDEYLKLVEDNYIEDAYHSLSIEGYQVTSELIEKVRDGNWDPDNDEADKRKLNAMAARGYYQAFQAVKMSIKSILEGKNAGEVAENEHGTWYRELFAPSVMAGILKISDLAGYRNGQVYIRGSMHTPLNPAAVRDAMPVLFDLLKEETEPSVRAILGHFLFVYIHPYMDGNGRIGRFLFNAMLASGGYPWTIIPLERREEYMDALERASVDHDITGFVQFIASLVDPKTKPAN